MLDEEEVLSLSLSHSAAHNIHHHTLAECGTMRKLFLHRSLHIPRSTQTALMETSILNLNFFKYT